MRRLLLTLALVLLPITAWAQSPIISGNLTGTTCPGAACLTLSVNGMGAASVQLAGTFSGTVQFESTVDGITYSALLMTKATDASTATSSTGVGVWSAWVGGQSIVRARVSSYASGTVRVTIGGALGLAAPGLSGVLLGNGVQPATAVALPNDATQFFDGTGAFSVPPDTGLVNAFTSAPVSGQTTITASGATALTFVAGSNVTLTTNNTTKALTIAASGGGGGGTPGGALTSIQFNNSGTFDGFGAWDGVSLSFQDTAGDVLAGAANTFTLATALGAPMTVYGTNNVVTTAALSDISLGYWNIFGSGNTLDAPVGDGSRDQFEILIAGSNNTVAGALGNNITIVGSETYVETVGVNASEITVLGSNQSIYQLDNARQTVLVGSENMVVGLGDGGTATATFLVGQGNTFTVTDATSIADSTFVYGWANTLTVPAMNDWPYTVSVGVSNTIGFGGTMTFGNHLTPTAANQTWFGDTVHPVFFVTGGGSAAFSFAGGTATFDNTVTATGLHVSGLTTPTNKPVCFDASGNLYAGSNTGGVLSCP